jgi:hypothetical protein
MKTYYTDVTESGDSYRATDVLWSVYRKAFEDGDWGTVESLEACDNPDFQYCPQEESEYE